MRGVVAWILMQSILQPILESELTFPALECLHILGFALGVGCIALVDFRILGLALPSLRASELAEDLSRWTTAGLTLTFLAAGGLFYSDPDLYYLNPSFQLKMTLLLAALGFHYAVRQPAALRDEAGTWTAAVSLALWSGVVFCGIFIAFTGEAQ